MRSISWHQLEYFLVVARTQHISRAAQELGLSQPALSRAIANLETTLKVPLFQRVGRSIVLTRFGEIFQQRVDRALHEIDVARAELADLVSADSGLVALGFVRSLGVEFLPNLVRRFKDHYENVRFTFVQNTGRELDKKILNGQIDLAFGPRGAPDLEWTVVFEQEYRLIVPISHPLARARKVALASLKHERFVSFKEDRKFREITEGFCKQAGFIPNYSFEGDDISSIIGFVGSGFGIAIVSPQDVKSSQRVTSLHLEPPPHRPIGISWLKNRYLSSGARRFRDFVLSGGNIHILENAL